MIIKSFELNKINLDKHKIILLYGNNEGFKSSVIESLTKNKGQLLNYDEKEVLSNSDIFLEEISNNSLFENEKCIHIKEHQIN